MFRPVESGHRSETVRRANLSAIVAELHQRGSLTRSELGTRTGLTRSAIRRLIGELSAAGLVQETPAGSSGAPGRPSPVVRIDPRAAVVLAVEIAVDSLAAATIGLGGEMQARERIDRPRRQLGVEAIVGDLARLVDRQREAWSGGARFVGAAAAVVGVVRRSDGLVSMAPNLGWSDVQLGAILGRTFGFPVAVANEADLGALAEHRRGAAKGRRDVVFLSGEVGVGGGLIVGGEPLTGAAGYAGEVGHLPVNPIAGRTCRCGSTGCWETEVGEEALLVLAGEPPEGGRAAVERILARAEDGDEQALRALREVGRWLGIGLAGVVNVLDPELIVLGGRFERLHPWVADPISSEISARALGAPGSVVGIVPASLGVDAPLLGAAELALEPILADPAGWFHRTPGRRALASA